MLLSGRPDSAEQQTQKIELPPRPDELSFETRRFPVTDLAGDARQVQEREGRQAPKAIEIPPEIKGSEDIQPERTSPAGSATPTESPPAARQNGAGQQPAEPTVMPPGVSATASGDSNTGRQQRDGRYVIQVASLSSANNASRLASSLQEKGYPVLIDTVESEVGRLNRVRVGPFETEAEAARLSASIGTEFAGVSPQVVDLSPEQSATADDAAGPLARWVVQVGSFADSSNAERVVEQLKAEGMSAYRETVKTSSATIFRVRVGPFLERKEAQSVRQLLSERLSIDGVVMTAD